MSEYNYFVHTSVNEADFKCSSSTVLKMKQKLTFDNFDTFSKLVRESTLKKIRENENVPAYINENRIVIVNVVPL